MRQRRREKSFYYINLFHGMAGMGILSKLFNLNALSIIAFFVILWNRATIEVLLFDLYSRVLYLKHEHWLMPWNKQKPIVFVNIISHKLCTNLQINSKLEFIQPKWSTVDLCYHQRFTFHVTVFPSENRKIYFCIIFSYFYANENKRRKKKSESYSISAPILTKGNKNDVNLTKWVITENIDTNLTLSLKSFVCTMCARRHIFLFSFFLYSFSSVNFVL